MKQYAQWQFATHRATLLKITGVATSAFILMFLFVKYVSHRDLQTQSDDLTLLWIGCFAFCGAQVFPNLLSKQERTSLLMLPASNAEKFLTSYIGVLLTAFVVPLVSFFVADVVQWLISLLTDHKQALLLTPLAFSDALDLLSKFFGENAQIAWAGLPNILWLHSFYLLSGLFFKKLRWLSATITLGALGHLDDVIHRHRWLPIPRHAEGQRLQYRVRAVGWRRPHARHVHPLPAADRAQLLVVISHLQALAGH